MNIKERVIQKIEKIIEMRETIEHTECEDFFVEIIVSGNHYIHGKKYNITITVYIEDAVESLNGDPYGIFNEFETIERVDIKPIFSIF